MGLPVTTDQGGICFAFPDVCLTPSGGGPVPVPYPNIGQLGQAVQTSDGSQGTGRVEVGGGFVVLATASRIPTTTGDEAGTAGGGVRSGTIVGPVEFPQGSTSVQVHGRPVVRMLDPTDQNNRNARGTVLGGVPNVLVGG